MLHRTETLSQMYKWNVNINIVERVLEKCKTKHSKYILKTIYLVNIYTAEGNDVIRNT